MQADFQRSAWLLSGGRRGALALFALLAAGWLGLAAAAQTPASFPGAHWDQVPGPEPQGWSSAKLKAAHDFAESIGSAALFIVHRGRVVDDWGQTTERFKVHSIRKSFLSALYGIPAAAGKICLSDTLGELGIDDNEPRLTAREKEATVADLLKARSGVYHPALYETAAMKKRRPARGSHPPGTYWYYNNWDFNALGTIFEKRVGLTVFEAFDRYLAQPLQMEDFRLQDTEYVRGSDSIHPAYPFRMTARDMARFGLLFARGGQWRGQQIVPADWVARSTTAYSPATTEAGQVHAGYGYLWWTELGGRHLENVELPQGTFSARGAGGHYILVVPVWDLVIVHRVDTDKKDGPRVERAQFGKLVQLLLEAMPLEARQVVASPAPPVASLPQSLDELVPALMTKHQVPGVSIVGIEDRRIAWERQYGVRSQGQPEPVDAQTLFEAASMSKLPAAYLALKLVEQGRLDLDRPLREYLDQPYLTDEPQHLKITARMVLSHTTGFPNWRKGGWRSGGPLPVLSEPGTKFTYSGEGFTYLQRVMEHITGEPFERYVKRTLFEPLGITTASYVWEDGFEKLAAGLRPEQRRNAGQTHVVSRCQRRLLAVLLAHGIRSLRGRNAQAGPFGPPFLERPIHRGHAHAHDQGRRPRAHRPWRAALGADLLRTRLGHRQNGCRRPHPPQRLERVKRYRLPLLLRIRPETRIGHRHHDQRGRRSRVMARTDRRSE